MPNMVARKVSCRVRRVVEHCVLHAIRYFTLVNEPNTNELVSGCSNGTKFQLVFIPSFFPPRAVRCPVVVRKCENACGSDAKVECLECTSERLLCTKVASSSTALRFISYSISPSPEGDHRCDFFRFQCDAVNHVAPSRKTHTRRPVGNTHHPIHGAPTPPPPSFRGSCLCTIVQW